MRSTALPPLKDDPPMTRTIALSRQLPPVVVNTIAAHGKVRMPPDGQDLDQAGLIGLMRDADAALVTSLDPISAEVLAACPRLKILANIGVGTNNIDLKAAHARGITVTNTPGAMDNAVADLAMGLVIGAARRLHQADAFVRAGQWTADNMTGFGMGLDVSGKTLGVVGFGRIGQALAKRARGFDMPVLYWARNRVDAATETALNAQMRTLPALLEQADFVVLLVPYGEATHHLIGAEQLAQMKPGAVLVNIARGGIVDDAALADALKTGHLAGAALDCVENEPSLYPELMGLPNVLLTPHIGSATAGTRQAMVALALRNLLAALNDQVPPNLVAS